MSIIRDHDSRTGGTTVRPATATDIPALAGVLAAAFQDDPVFSWMAPNPRVRRRHLAGWFTPVVEGVLSHHRTYCVGDGSATALWVPPGTEPLSPEQEDRLGAATATMGAVALTRFAALIGEMAEHHPPAPHEYLWFLGTAPVRQGQGLGGALLGSRLAVLDETGAAAYLEATSPRNRALYERHGFRVTGEISAAGSPPMWAMWRDPA